MKTSLYLLFAMFITFGCATNDSVSKDHRTIRTKAVAVKVENNSTVLSTGRLDDWYRVDTPLTEGVIYEVTLEIPRVTTEPVIVPAKLEYYNHIEFLQRDQYLRYIVKYQELKSVRKSNTPVASSKDQ